MLWQTARRPPAGAWIAFALVVSANACAGQADRQTPAVDPAALATLGRINAGMTSLNLVPPGDLDQLRAIHARYPTAPEVRQVLQAAYQIRKDWSALEALLTAQPEAQRTRPDQIALSMVYLNLGRYENASRILGPLAEATPSDVDVNSLAGRAWYHQGQYDQAARVLDRVWDAIIEGKRLDDLMMRGMIAFYGGDHRRALDLLRQAVAIDPEFIPGHYSLSRVLVAQGDLPGAEQSIARAEAAQSRRTTEETRRLRFVSHSHDLSAAWEARRYQDCIRHALQMLETADAPLKPTLYEYLGQSYRALGRELEAKAALAEAARLRSEPKGLV